MNESTQRSPWILHHASHRTELLWLLARADGNAEVAAEIVDLDPDVERRMRRRYVIDGPPHESDRARRRRFGELWHVHLALLERLADETRPVSRGGDDGGGRAA